MVHGRNLYPQLTEKLQHATHVLLLINDGAIETFAAQHLANSKAILIHFSGSLVSERIHGAHPLMTFSQHLYSLEDYQQIPFVVDHDAPDFATLLPGIPNQQVRLQKSLRPKYHALCVMSGNFSCILWQKFFRELESEFAIPHTIALPYMQRQTQNLSEHPMSALTGPLARGDEETIRKNLQALDADPFREIYESFVACYQEVKKAEEGV